MTGGPQAGAGDAPRDDAPANGSTNGSTNGAAHDDVVATVGDAHGGDTPEHPGERPAGEGPDGTADGAPSGIDADASAEPTPEERLAAAEALADEHWNGRLRLQAELENQRKRGLRDVQNARKFGLEPLLNDLLPVLDSLDLGVQASRAENATVESLREGTEITLRMFATMLEKHGIAVVDPQGDKFDPAFHQAMSMQAVEGAAPNTVVQVLQKGYTLNERLLRPALVMVAK